MNRRKRRTAHTNHERWLVSYADFITLLFAFFVVLYSSAQVDKRKIGQLATAIQVAFQEMGVFSNPSQGVPAQSRSRDTTEEIEKAVRVAESGSIQSPRETDAGRSEDIVRLRQDLEAALGPELLRKEVALRSSADGLVISLREIGFFESGSADVRAESLPAFSRIAALLATHRCRIRIEGHTDNIPIHNHNFRDNWELSTARAVELVRLLITRYGFAAERLSAAGYAEFHPVASNESIETRAQNRRVDIVVIGRLVTAASGDESPSTHRPAKDGSPPDHDSLGTAKPSAAIPATPAAQ
jgi:chemotaxis protein MotB